MKISSDGTLVFGDEQGPRSMPLDGGQSFDNSNILARDLGDDIVVEGVLSQSGHGVVQEGLVIV
jgi:hypothetical protein